MSPSNDDTQPVRAIQSSPGCIKRIVQLLFLAIFVVGIFAFGYATGSGVEVLAHANAIIETAIASFPDSLTTLSARLPQPNFTLADTDVPSITASDRPISTAAEPLTSVTPQPAATQVSVATVTDTPLPTDTPSCYQHQHAWVSGQMNVREQPSINAQRVGSALAGERFDVLESRQDDSYCWLRISRGWMAKTAYVSATEPQQPLRSVAGGSVGQALANLSALVVAPDNRCSPYDSGSYPHSQSVEAQIVARMGGFIYIHYIAVRN